MTIRIPFSTILYDLFPGSKGDQKTLLDAMKVFYTVRGVAPEVSLDGDTILLKVDAERIEGRERMFRDAVSLCERGKFREGRERLTVLATEDPTNSEYHRMLGQVCSEMGDQDAAINHLIDALRWDPKNKYALTMMGNIWARDRNDMETALRYYEAALAVDPKDHLAANNIAVQFMQRGDWKVAEEWFDKAMSIEPDYPNTHHGLAMVSLQQGDPASAFFEATEALRLNAKRDELYRQSYSLAKDLAGVLSAKPTGASIVRAEAQALGDISGKPVRIVAEPEIPTAAKLEIAENYDRQEHVVRFKPDYPCVEHLQLHELYHLRYTAEARTAGTNELFISRTGNKEAFIRNIGKNLTRLSKEGYSETVLANYATGLFDGLNRQIFNAPIDLFIEYDMYRDHPDMRPYQFLSLARLIDEAVQATTDKRIVELAPGDILSKSKTYNLTLAMVYHDLFGVDRVPEFKSAGLEKQTAERFYAEFKEYREDRKPGEEYELVHHWAEDLKVTPYFELINEQEYRGEASSPSAGDSLEDQLNEIEADPMDRFKDDPVKAREMRTFLEGQEALGLNMAVAMYMVDALQYFKDMPTDKVKQAALEIAMLGTQGIHPEKKGYKLASVPGKTFSGYHLLAYYYITWKLAIPEMLEQLQLPYDKEYETALLISERS